MVQIPSQLRTSEVTILPRNEKLLQSVRAALQRIGASIADEQSRFELVSIDYILAELLLREHTAFYAAYYADSVKLAKAGLAEIIEHCPENAVAIEAAVARLPNAVDPEPGF